MASFELVQSCVSFDQLTLSRTQVYDRLGHTLAPYELEYCERWASENILSEHGEEGLKLKKGGLPGSKFLGGVFSCFSK